MLARLEASKKSNASSGAEDGPDCYSEVGKAGKTARGMLRLMSRARNSPSAVARSCRAEIERARCVRRGMAWTYLDRGKRHIER